MNTHRAKRRIYQDYRELLEQKDLDADFVAAGDRHHVLASILACQAGKDVYCEKPLSLYVREGRALVTHGKEKGTDPFCAQHPAGRSGKRGLSLFPPRSSLRVLQFF